MIASCHICLAEAAPAISGPAAVVAEETRPLTQRLSAFEIWRAMAPLASKKTIRMCRWGDGCSCHQKDKWTFHKGSSSRNLTGLSAPAFDVARGTVCSHQQHCAVVYLGFAETQSLYNEVIISSRTLMRLLSYTLRTRREDSLCCCRAR